MGCESALYKVSGVIPAPRPKSLQEMVDMLRAEQAARAVTLAWEDPENPAHVIEVGKWRGKDELLGRIEEWIKPPKESKD